jgi:hypothetical protein
MTRFVILSAAKDLTLDPQHAIGAGARSFAALRMTEGADVGSRQASLIFVVLSAAKDLTPGPQYAIGAGARSFAPLRMTEGADCQ